MADPEHTPQETSPEVSQSRLQLLWDVLVFQFKLALDGLRDVLLVPVSLVAALIGLLIGGSRPAQYFEQVLKFGRRTEFWINLFGYRRRGGTSDEIIDPLKERVFAEADNIPWLQKAGSRLNKSLDTVGKAITNPSDSDSPPRDKP